ncbi:MAG: 50S ribosomal protein L2 [Verrucomicrobia bacterium GWC2_42_7]|nr:MAG: 50S ribosomal protein L2 [Verrucomicrobia bacterium GWC2_42_7]
MAIIQRRPLTPGQRFLIVNKQDLAENNPERRLVKSLHRVKGRNCYGRITSRRRGGGHKQLYRVIDFKRDKYEIPGKVTSIEYDPNRTANIALIVYPDGDKRYILAPRDLQIGHTVISTNSKIEDFTPGICLPLSLIPPATPIHAVEMTLGKGAQIARGAGVGAMLMAVEGNQALVKMPSGEIRYVHARCRATIGVIGNPDHQNQSLGKAGRNRWLGRRPRVRGVAMNPVDHPMGGGRGRTAGGGHPVSPWGQLSKGYPTRTKSKPSNSMIVTRRNGKKVKKG